MKLNNLLLHCGAAHVEPEQLERVKTPMAEGRWQPIGHAELASQVRRGLENAGMKVLVSSTARMPFSPSRSRCCCPTPGVEISVNS